MIKTEGLDGIAFSLAFETGSRAIDAFYIAAAEIKNAILVSNDKITDITYMYLNATFRKGQRNGNWRKLNYLV